MASRACGCAPSPGGLRPVPEGPEGQGIPAGSWSPSAACSGSWVKEVTRRLGQVPCPDPARGIPAVLAAGIVHPLKIRSDPVGSLPAAMPRMISAAGQLRRCGCPPAIRRQAGDLPLTLGAVECHASLGGLAAAPRALLRDLVIVTARLAGHPWLETSGGNTAAFTQCRDLAVAAVAGTGPGSRPCAGGPARPSSASGSSLDRTDLRWRLTPPLWRRTQTRGWW